MKTCIHKLQKKIYVYTHFCTNPMSRSKIRNKVIFKSNQVIIKSLPKSQ